MINIKSLTYYLLPALLLCSCSTTEDTYEPAKPVADDCIGAYFPKTNKSEFIKADTDDKNLDITVVREKTNSSVSIPVIVVSKTDNIVVPSTVDFAAGDSATTLTVTYTDLETTPKFDIKLDEEYTNPYEIKAGSSEFCANVYRLNLISDSVVVDDYDSSNTTIFKGCVNKIYQMGNENKFIWRDFMNSGIDLKFKLDGHFDSSNIENCYGSVIPLNHNGDDGAYGWYVMEAEDWTAEGASEYTATWEAPNGTVDSWLYIYYDYEGSSYFYMDFRPTTSKKSGRKYGYGYIWTGLVNSFKNPDSSVFWIWY